MSTKVTITLLEVDGYGALQISIAGSGFAEHYPILPNYFLGYGPATDGLIPFRRILL